MTASSTTARTAIHVDQILTRAHGGRMPGDLDRLPEWARLAAVQAAVELLTGAGERCAHRRHGPLGMTIAAAWAPGQLVCPACQDRLHPPSEREHTCDACGADGPLRIGVLQWGPLTFTYATCTSCAITSDPARNQARHR